MNESGITPQGYAVLVKLHPVEPISSVIAMTEAQVVEKQHAQTKATVVAIGPLAWSDETVGEVVIPRAKVGDNVLIKRFAGDVVEGRDKEKYRLLNDKDIYATLE